MCRRQRRPLLPLGWRCDRYSAIVMLGGMSAASSMIACAKLAGSSEVAMTPGSSFRPAAHSPHWVEPPHPADGCSSGMAAPSQPLRRTATSDGGVMSAARAPAGRAARSA